MTDDVLARDLEQGAQGGSLRIGRVMSRYFGVLRANAGRIAVITLITQLPFHLGIVFSTFASFSELMTAVSTGDASDLVSTLIKGRYAAGAYAFTFAIGPLLSFYTAAALTKAAGEYLVTGRFCSIGEALLPGFGFLFRTAVVIVETEIICVFAVVMIIMGGFFMMWTATEIALIMIIAVPVALYMAIAWMIGMFIPALSIMRNEGIGAIAAMPASRRLTENNRWRVFGAISVVFASVLLLVFISILIGNGLSAVPVTAGWLAPVRWLWPLISCFLLNALFAAMTAVLFTVLYEELRFLKHGPRADPIAAVFD